MMNSIMKINMNNAKEMKNKKTGDKLSNIKENVRSPIIY